MRETKDYQIKHQNTLSFLDYSSKEGKMTKKRYDEPTYLTFRINFFPESNVSDSGISHLSNNVYNNFSFNDMPEPLLELNDENKYYSSYKYLKDFVNESYRASLLEDFINLLFELNFNFPYYIKSIDGINDLLDVDVKRGTRIKKDAVLTIKCYEGLDQRITTLKKLYKKIAWDDEYQRWILPDMMRYFKMDIYISEFRIFHKSKTNNNNSFVEKNMSKNASKVATINTIKNVLQDLDNLLGMDKSVGYEPWILTSDVINDIIPTTKIECRMCEFDISNMFSELSSLLANNPKEKLLDDLEIKIKVGNINEVLVNNLITSNSKGDNNKVEGVYISDKILKLKDKKIDGKIYPTENKNDNNILFTKRTGIEKNEGYIADTDMFNDTKQTKRLSYLGKMLKDTIKGAFKWGDNWTNDQLNKLYNTQLGKSGLTTSDIIRAVTSANINTIYNTFKTKAQAIKEQYPELSKATEQEIDVQVFESFMNSLANSNDDTQSTIAKTLLNWGKENDATIDDYLNIISEATALSNKEKQLLENLSKSIDDVEIKSKATKEDNKINTKIIL